MNKIGLLLIVLLCINCKNEKAELSLAKYQQWHTIEIPFEGPETSESAEENPFLNYKLEVTFKHEETEYQIRGFYAADGNSAETSADAGNVWKVRFTPDKIGRWSYSAQLFYGDSIAIKSVAATKIDLSSAAGQFEVLPSKKTGKDFRAHGRLIADNGYFKFKDSDAYWLKGGADSPENLLAFEDFDATYRMQSSNDDGEAKTNDTIHSYAPHLEDWNEGDVTWQDGKGKGLVGALNYLASKNMNVAYFLTLNIKGDGKDVWPYVDPDDFTRFDVSKLAQWEIVFQHMQSKGILLHMVLQETENETMLDDGDTGPLRRLYFQELVARFGHHLGLNFNLGEENGYADFSPISQNDQQRKAMTDFLTEIDPYNHPILLHTHSHEPARGAVLDSIIGFKNLDGLSLQVDKREAAAEVVTTWKEKSVKAGHNWMITMDEIGLWHTGAQADEVTPNHDSLRGNVLWGTLLSGAAGVEWYFGAHNFYNDLNAEDWRTRDRLWELTDHALSFFQNYLPYWEMQPNKMLVNDPKAHCFMKEDEVYALYLPEGKLQTIDLSHSQVSYTVRWYNPLNGGDLQLGSVETLTGGAIQAIGNPPTEVKQLQDWVVLLQVKENK